MNIHFLYTLYEGQMDGFYQILELDFDKRYRTYSLTFERHTYSL
jgi:hypothetical protein